ncbi:hypothetical protein A9Q81_17225 [Gammaproteobacteria bacterium 42_54_T18]|nr:hypothetical protein A9Q81_17225 [Gammaproteobacteria bacterium 42_54_T18]
MNIVTRNVLPDDAAALLELKKALFSETQFMLYEADEYPASAEQETGFINHFNESVNSTILASELDGELVGFLGAAGGDSKKIKHSAQIFLGVRKKHWGQGIASALLTETMSWARRIQLKRLELTVSSNNHRAIKMYHNQGFELEGIKKCAISSNGNFEDECVMGYVLK